MSEVPPLNGAVLHESGTFFVLLKVPDAEDDESVLAVGRREGNTLRIRTLGDLDEIVSLMTFPLRGFEGALAGALSADGRLYLADENGSRSEIIPDESALQEDGRILRRMRTLHFLDDTLYACGFGDQVYMRRANEDWHDISFSASDLTGGHAVFYHVTRGEGFGPLFGGIYAHERELTDALKAASAAGNAKLFRQLARAARRPDHMLVAEYRAGWNVLFTDHPGVVAWLAAGGNGQFFLVSDTGIIWQTRDFLVLDEIWKPSSPQAFDDIKLWKGNPVLLRGEDLFILRQGEMRSFEPALPREAHFGLSLWAAGESLIYARRDAIWILEESAWTKLTLSYDEP